MPTLHYRGDRNDVRLTLARLPAMLAGHEPDPTGAIDGLKLRIGLTLLALIRDNFIEQSDGKPGEFGTWAPLSPVTLALRRANTAPSTLARIRQQVGRLDPVARRQFESRERLLLDLYLGRGPYGKSYQRSALSILRRKKREIPEGRYRQMEKILTGGIAEERARKLATAQAYAQILRDTGRLLNSLSPETRGPETICRVEHNGVTVGTNVEYAKYHQSKEKRRMREDQSEPVLPRRQFLPDRDRLPASWKRAVTGALLEGLSDPQFWRILLSQKGQVS